MAPLGLPWSAASTPFAVLSEANGDLLIADASVRIGP